jgi:hypothetical protein
MPHVAFGERRGNQVGDSSGGCIARLQSGQDLAEQLTFQFRALRWLEFDSIEYLTRGDQIRPCGRTAVRSLDENSYGLDSGFDPRACAVGYPTVGVEGALALTQTDRAPGQPEGG